MNNPPFDLTRITMHKSFYVLLITTETIPCVADRTIIDTPTHTCSVSQGPKKKKDNQKKKVDSISLIKD